MKSNQNLKRVVYLLLAGLVIFTILVGCDLIGLGEDEEEARVVFITEEILTIKTVSRGAPVSAPTAPTKEGHTFDGWYTTTAFTTPWNFSNAVDGDMTLYAKWNPNQITVTFDNKTGAANPTVTADYGTTITAPSDPTNGTKDFGGWFKDAAGLYQWNFATDVVQEDITLHAIWFDDMVTVSFTSNGGSAVGDRSVEAGTTVTAPTEPIKEGNTFAGWYTDIDLSTTWSFETVVTTDITLYAKWTPVEFTVTFDDKTDADDQTVTADYGTTITAPSDPVREGYTFKGWFKDDTGDYRWNFTADTVTADTTLYAKWAEIVPDSILTAYRAAELADVAFSNTEFEADDVSSFTPEQLIEYTVPGALNTIGSAVETIMGSVPNIRPRSISANFTLQVKDEAIETYMVNEDTSETITSHISIDHFDLELAASVNKFVELALGFSEIDPALLVDVLLAGKLGVSSYLTSSAVMEGETEPLKSAIGLYLDFNLTDVGMGTEGPEGLIDATVAFSVATNTIMEFVEDGPPNILRVPALVKIELRAMEDIPLSRAMVAFDPTTMSGITNETSFLEWCNNLYGTEGESGFLTINLLVEGEDSVSLTDFDALAFFMIMFQS